MLLVVLLFVLCLSQALSDDLKVQLAQQQAAASDATQALASRDEELQKIKASSTTEVQAWQVKADELKEVRAALCAGSEAVLQHARRERQHDCVCTCHCACQLHGRALLTS